MELHFYAKQHSVTTVAQSERAGSLRICLSDVIRLLANSGAVKLITDGGRLAGLIVFLSTRKLSEQDFTLIESKSGSRRAFAKWLSMISVLLLGLEVKQLV